MSSPADNDREARYDPDFLAEGARHDGRPSREELVDNLPEPERSIEIEKNWRKR